MFPRRSRKNAIDQKPLTQCHQRLVPNLHKMNTSGGQLSSTKPRVQVSSGCSSLVCFFQQFKLLGAFDCCFRVVGFSKHSRRTGTFWKKENNKNKLRFSGAKMIKGPRTPDFCNTSFCLRPYAVLKGKSQSEWTGSGASNCSCESCSRFWSIKRSRKDKSCTWHDFRKCFGGLLRTFFLARLHPQRQAITIRKMKLDLNEFAGTNIGFRARARKIKNMLDQRGVFLLNLYRSL